MWDLTPLAVTHLLAATLQAMLAALVFRASPGRAENQRLATLLAFLAADMLIVGALRATADPINTYALHRARSLALWPALITYLWFLALVPTPLTAWLRTRAFLYSSLGVGLGLAAFHLVDPGFMGDQMVRVAGGPAHAVYIETTAGVIARSYAWQVILVYGLVVAAAAYLHARGTARRREMRAYLFAFAGHDLLWLALLSGGLGLWGVFWSRAAGIWANDLLGVVATLWLTIGLAYGMARSQLFDIDLRIKVGISRTTVAAIVASAAFIGSELVEFALGVDKLVPALLIAGLATLAFGRLVKLGNALAHRLMPHVEDTAEYRTVRKREVYAAAYEAAVQDGAMTPRERSVLGALATSLRLDDKTVEAVHKERAA